jgi:hypothetical protein
MAIYRLMQEAAFDDRAVQAMISAYETAVVELGLTSRADPVRQIIARKIVELATTGERDPHRLCEKTLDEFRG